MCSILTTFAPKSSRNGSLRISSETTIPPATKPWTCAVQIGPLTGYWNCSDRAFMQTQPDRNSIVGYVVSTWPRLSQTFVLNEILALERLGLPMRIYSTKDPDGEPVHADVARVRAEVTYLSLRTNWRAILRGNLRTAWNQPGRYLRNLFRAIRYRGRAIQCCF